MEAQGNGVEKGGLKQKFRSIFSRNKPAEQVPSMGTDMLTEDQANEVCSKFFNAMAGDQEEVNFWQENSDTVREIFSNESFKREAYLMLTAVNNAIKRFESATEMRENPSADNLRQATILLLEHKDALGSFIDREFAGERAVPRIALEVLVGLSDMNLMIGSAVEFYECVAGKIPMAYDKMMKSQVEGRVIALQNVVGAVRLLRLASDHGDDVEKLYVITRAKELLFERGQVSLAEIRMAEELIGMKGGALGLIVEQITIDYLSGLGLNNDELSSVWSWTGVCGKELISFTRLANLRTIADLAREGKEIPRTLFSEDGVRNFVRFSPEQWKTMHRERENIESDWVLVIGARSDDRGAFATVQEDEGGVGMMITSLAELGIVARYIEAESVEELAERLESLKEKGLKKAKGLVIMSHGREDGSAALGNPLLSDNKGQDFYLNATDILQGRISAIKVLVDEKAPGVMVMCFGDVSLTKPLGEMGVKMRGSKYSIRGSKITPSLSDGFLSLLCETEEITPTGVHKRVL